MEELGSAPAFGGRAGGSSGGLAELLTAGMSPRAAVDPSPAGMVTCRLCGMFVDPERFCSDCGAPLPQVRVA